MIPNRPDWGRFLQRDALETPNLYSFLDNSPLTAVDPEGRERQPVDIAGDYLGGLGEGTVAMGAGLLEIVATPLTKRWEYLTKAHREFEAGNYWSALGQGFWLAPGFAELRIGRDQMLDFLKGTLSLSETLREQGVTARMAGQLTPAVASLILARRFRLPTTGTQRLLQADRALVRAERAGAEAEAATASVQNRSAGPSLKRSTDHLPIHRCRQGGPPGRRHPPFLDRMAQEGGVNLRRGTHRFGRSSSKPRMRPSAGQCVRCDCHE